MISVAAGAAERFGATLGASVLLFRHFLGYNGINFQLPLIVYLFVASKLTVGVSLKKADIGYHYRIRARLHPRQRHQQPWWR